MAKDRLKEIEEALSPKQIFLRWLLEAHRFESASDYHYSLKDTPIESYPQRTVPKRAREVAIQAMSDKSSDEIDRADQEAVREVHFLFHLHDKVNELVWEGARQRALLLTVLSQEVIRTLGLLSTRMRIWETTESFRDYMPYPLDSDAHEAVQAAARHRVILWYEEAREVSPLLAWARQWVSEYFRKQERTPLISSKLMEVDLEAERLRGFIQGDGDDLVPPDGLTPDQVESLRKKFGGDQDAVDRYLAGRDYSFGFTNVTNAEFLLKLHSIECALKELAQSGTIQEGEVVWLRTIPNKYLAEAPLLEGRWLDRYVMEIAEWGALLLERGFRFVDSADGPAAWDRIYPPGVEAGEGTPEASPEELEAIRQEA